MNKKIFPILILVLVLIGMFFYFGFRSTEVISGNAILLQKSSDNLNVGQEIRIDIEVIDIIDLSGVQIDITYNPNVFNYSKTEEGTFLNENGFVLTYFNESEVIVSPGFVDDIIIFRKGEDTGVTGSGLIASIYLNASDPGFSDIILLGVLLSDSIGESISTSSLNTNITVTGSIIPITVILLQSEWWVNETTNFSIYNNTQLQVISNVKFGSQYGKIDFLENINISQDRDLRTKIKILNNIIWVNSSLIPEFNKSAQLTFRNVNLVNPIIKRDNTDCPSLVCQNINFNNVSKIYTLNISSFSVYELVEQCFDGVQNYDETGVDCGGSCSACSTGEGTGGSSGGGGSGGGGGGGGRTSPSANFDINIKEILLELRQGDSEDIEFIVKNLGATDLEFSISSDLEILDIEDSFTLIGRESKKVVSQIIIREDQTPNLYIGRIYIKSESITKEILFSIEVISGEIFLSVEVGILFTSQYVSQGEEVSARISLTKIQELETDNVTLTYIIKGEDGALITSETEEINIKDFISFTKNIRLPRELNSGKYIFYVQADYGGEISSSSAWFNVEEKGVLLFLKKNLFLVSLVNVILVILIIFLLVYFRKKRLGERSPKEKKTNKFERENFNTSFL